MKYKKIILIFSVILIFIICIFSIKGYVTIKINNNKLKEAIYNIQEDNVLLNDVIPFEWEEIYTFAPYTPEEEIEKIIGFKSIYIHTSISEGMANLIFIKNKKIVCNIYGNIESLGYSINFYDGKSSYNKIKFNENINFNVEKNNNIININRY